jgi:alkylation response protein AidB-like acyl-CoA dehydrogenase
VEEFVREECEPLDLVIWESHDLNDPVRQALIPPLQEIVRERGLWATHLGPHLDGPGFGQLKPALLNEILGCSECAPIVYGSQAPDSGNSETARALQIHGSLGTTHEMPFVHYLVESFVLGLADGPIEVHKVTLTREALKEFRPSPDVFPSEGPPPPPGGGRGEGGGPTRGDPAVLTGRACERRRQSPSSARARSSR